MKICSVCKENKSFNDFTRKKTTKDGYNAACKSCTRFRSKKHYLENKTYYVKKARKHNRKMEKENKEKIKKLKETPCADCGIQYPYYVMDFDHLKDKEWNVSRGVNNGKTWTALCKEIEKCEIVCANCHRKRTYERKFLV